MHVFHLYLCVQVADYAVQQETVQAETAELRSALTQSLSQAQQSKDAVAASAAQVVALNTEMTALKQKATLAEAALKKALPSSAAPADEEREYQMFKVGRSSRSLS